MEDLAYNYARFKEEKAKFETLQEIDPREDDALYKYLLHKLRDLKEDLVERIEEIQMDLDSVKSVLEYEKESIQDVNLR